MKTTTFDDRGRLSRERLNQLQQRHDGPALLRLTVQIGLIALLLVVVFRTESESRWMIALAAMALGLVQASLFAAMHECVHLTAFRSRRINQIVSWFAGFAVLWAPSTYREFHFEHHRHTHDPELDPEISLGGESFANWPVRLHEYFALASGVLLLIMRLLMLCFAAISPPQTWWTRWAPYVRSQARPRIIWESRLFLLGYLIIAVCAVGWIPRLGYLAISLLVAHSVLALYLASEHTGCEMTGSIFDRTRTVLTTGWVRFLMWNMPYHSEHHAYPSIPFHALPRLHQALRDDLVFVHSGYGQLHRSVVQGICSGNSTIHHAATTATMHSVDRSIKPTNTMNQAESKQQ